MAAELEFWFDFLSPYAYFAWLRIRDLAARNGATVTPRPVLLAALLDHHGQLGPAEIPAKRVSTFKDIARYAAEHGIPLAGPAAHPFNPLHALRASLPQVAGRDQERVITTLYDAGWGRGIDLGDPTALAGALSEAGLDGPGLLAATRRPEVKQALKDGTVQAAARGVFGVPTVGCLGELFWGNDRLRYVELRLQGRDPLPEDLAMSMLDRPRGATRPASQGRGGRDST